MEIIMKVHQSNSTFKFSLIPQKTPFVDLHKVNHKHQVQFNCAQTKHNYMNINLSISCIFKIILDGLKIAIHKTKISRVLRKTVCLG